MNLIISRFSIQLLHTTWTFFRVASFCQSTNYFSKTTLFHPSSKHWPRLWFRLCLLLGVPFIVWGCVYGSGLRLRFAVWSWLAAGTCGLRFGLGLLHARRVPNTASVSNPRLQLLTTKDGGSRQKIKWVISCCLLSYWCCVPGSIYYRGSYRIVAGTMYSQPLLMSGVVGGVRKKQRVVGRRVGHLYQTYG